MLKAMRAAPGLLAALFFAGCGEDTVQHYRVAREPAAAPAAEHPHDTTHAGAEHAPPVQPQGPLRMLAAIGVHREAAWFFKLSGSAEAISPLVEAFDQFLLSLRFDAAPDRPIAWTLPAGWKETPGSGMRFATITAGAAPGAPEMTVVPLGAEAGGTLPNVNRWREQLGLDPITEADLGRVTRKIEVQGVGVVRVDLATPVGGGTVPVTPVPVPVTKGTPAGAPAFTAPTGWLANPNPGMGVAAFTVSEGGEKAEVSVIPLPGPAGGLLQNVNRWRGQLKLDPIAENQLAAAVRTLPVDGADASLVDLIAPEAAGAARERILGVIQVRGETTWFFKMKGAAAVVEKQKTAFEEFVRSVRFGGTGDPKEHH